MDGAVDGCEKRSAREGLQRFATKCRRLFNHKWLYLMLLPCLANFVIFHYWPMYGLQIAFKRFNIVLGAGASPWIGLEHFCELFQFLIISGK